MMLLRYPVSRAIRDRLASFLINIESIQQREEREAAEQFLEEYNALPILLLEPSNIADSVVFLVSPQAKYISGAVIDVAAGANAKYTA